MNELLLSKRLACVAAQVKPGDRVADIGSDHAYLPVYLIKTKQINFAVAGEVIKGPFETAQRQVQKSQLQEQIMVRLADGLAAIKESDAIDTIVIAGMGGQLIASILENGWQNKQLKKTQRLVLQPNLDENEVRLWLSGHGFGITHEEIIEEKNKIYEVIVASPMQEAAYSEKELFFGTFLMTEKNPVFQKKWMHASHQKQNVLKRLQLAKNPRLEKIKELQKQLLWIKEVLQ